MSDPHYLAIEPPKGRDLAEWLSTFDSTPAVMPEWPESQALAVVVVTTSGPEMTGGVVLSEARLARTATILSTPSGVMRLFFVVPRSFLLKAGTCPGLTPDSWVDHA